MTPLETLAKYGLKTDVKSIRERMLKNDYFSIVYGSDVTTDRHVSSVKKEADNLRTADLSLLCSFAEKGERENKLLELYRQFFKETNINIGLDDCDIDDFSSTFEYVDIENDKAEVDTVKRIQELEAEGEGK